MTRQIFNRLFIFVLPLILAACASTVTPNAGVANMPEWVRDPYTRFDRQAYVAVRGSGNTIDFAERSALGNLVAFFGQHIEINERAIERYQELVRDGGTAAWSINTELDTEILRHASFDSLIGAEIADIWNDGRSYYAVAILNRAQAIRVYSDIVNANQRMIDNLLDMPPAERNSLEGFARYQFAATVADITESYVSFLSVIGAPPMQGLRTGNDLRLQAHEITRAIPVYLQVQGDRSARIEGAFARAFSDLGFQSGGLNSRYRLNVNINISPAEITGSQIVFSRIELSANFVDTAFGTVMLPFNFNIREGHTSQAEADNRAIMAAERRINAEYANLLSDYLSRLLPR